MKYGILLFSVLLSAHAYAGPVLLTTPVGEEIPQNQNLVVVDYFSDGRQTGCGLRATGESSDGLRLNVLITVFQKETGPTFGVIKVVARKGNMKDSAPVLKDGQITDSSLGKIQKAWVTSGSGKQAFIYKGGGSSHSDAYMVNSEFSSTVDLLLAMSRENFKVGLNRNESGPDEIFQFDKRLDRNESAKLSLCMKKLRTAMEENKSRESF